MEVSRGFSHETRPPSLRFSWSRAVSCFVQVPCERSLGSRWGRLAGDPLSAVYPTSTTDPGRCAQCHQPSPRLDCFGVRRDFTLWSPWSPSWVHFSFAFLFFCHFRKLPGLHLQELLPLSSRMTSTGPRDAVFQCTCRGIVLYSYWDRQYRKLSRLTFVSIVMSFLSVHSYLREVKPALHALCKPYCTQAYIEDRASVDSITTMPWAWDILEDGLHRTFP